MRKRTFILGLAAFAAAVVFFANARVTRIAYHKWRLCAAVENSHTAGAGKPTAQQEFIALLRGPASAEDYAAAWQRHEDALVRLEYLTRRQFLLPLRADPETRARISEVAAKVFPADHLWSVTRSPWDDHAVLITAPARDMVKWEKLILRLGRQLALRHSVSAWPAF